MNNAVKIGLIIGVFSSATAFATDGAGTVQRDVNQQERIEAGLKSGELNTREAARLERQESVVDHMQAKALKDGEVSPAERAKLRRSIRAPIICCRHASTDGWSNCGKACCQLRRLVGTYPGMADAAEIYDCQQQEQKQCYHQRKFNKARAAFIRPKSLNGQSGVGKAESTRHSPYTRA